MQTMPRDVVENRQLVYTVVEHDSLVSKTDAQRIATLYVARHFGAEFSVGEIFFHESLPAWSFFIQRHFADLDRPVEAGRISIDAHTGQIVPLTADEILDIQERAIMLAERRRGHRLAYTSDGLLLSYQAKMKAKLYISDEIAFFADTEGRPTLIPGTPPVWRVETVVHLREQQRSIPVGPIDVNAITGEVIALSPIQLQCRRQKVEHAASVAQLSPTRAG